MKRKWTLEELNDFFMLSPKELELIGNKINENKLGFAVLLKFFGYEARFPESKKKYLVMLLSTYLNS